MNSRNRSIQNSRSIKRVGLTRAASGRAYNFDLKLSMEGQDLMWNRRLAQRLGVITIKASVTFKFDTEVGT